MFILPEKRDEQDEGYKGKVSLLNIVALTVPPSHVTVWPFTMPNVFLDIFIGNRAEHAKCQAAYEATCSLLAKNAKIYGLPRSPEDLSDEQQQILADLDVQIHCPLFPLSNI